MNTALSSRRIAADRRAAKETSRMSIAPLALVIGALLVAVGIMANSSIIAAAGFVGFIGSLLYYNAIFWGKVMAKHGISRDRINNSMYHL